jgi:cytochrome c oxidase subunit 2
VRPPAEAITSLGWVVGVIALVILVGVEAAIVYAAWRFRATRAEGVPLQIYGNTRLEVVWTAAPAVVLTVVFVLMLGTMQEIGASATAAGGPSGAMRIVAVGSQWWWEFRYPRGGGEVIGANELHIPIGTVIDLDLRSNDVIHSFWVPELGGKIDMVPGRINHLRLYAARAGVYTGQCAEYCGLEHAWMRITVIAEPSADFGHWLDAQAAPRAPPTGAAADGERVFLAAVCSSCHAIRGSGAASLVGPDLTHVGSRLTLGAGALRNSDQTMRAWIADPQSAKPGVLMPQVPLSPSDLDKLAVYLRSLK